MTSKLYEYIYFCIVFKCTLYSIYIVIFCILTIINISYLYANKLHVIEPNELKKYIML